ncbi:LCP family protein [Paenibacillus eucommiae]|uniref:LCP family protein required for cell wall assembly n=1 Tax=Paenibacillus eucommiae TaxID=1355755 RepID=A0ABS4J4I6_9BACL|nr:LCP family protein [Paenibacillus eucommiae]MBP1994749.1 LCP family protein required for cell wall assembly [Paenibacillus eucommiae]
MRSKPKKKKMHKALKISLVFVITLFIGISAYAGFLYSKANDALGKIAAPEPSPDTVKKPPTAVEEEEDPIMKPVSFLLAAVDYRKGSEGTLNTDVMILVSLNPKTRAATVVSFPRDLEVKAEESGLGFSHKLNYFYAHYSLQDKESAIQQTKELFSKIYEVPIDYMAVINFDGFRQLIDQLGGMNVYVDMDMKYTDTSDGTRINLKEGLQTLDGKNTLDFLRYRKSNKGTAESSDLARNERQQKVLDQMLDKLTSFNGIAGWSKILDIAGESIKTDIPEDQLRSYIGAFREMKPDTIEYINLNGEWESPYIVVEDETMEQALEALRLRLKPLVTSNGETLNDGIPSS